MKFPFWSVSQSRSGTAISGDVGEVPIQLRYEAFALDRCVLGDPIAVAVREAAEKPPKALVDPQVLEGYVKGGVVHLLEGELPDGIFVKIVPE